MKKGDVVTWVDGPFILWCFAEDLRIDTFGDAYSKTEIFTDGEVYVSMRTIAKGLPTPHTDLGEALLAELC